MIRTIALTLISLISEQAFGSEKCDPNSTKTSEILQCIKLSYDIVDLELNEQYAKIKDSPEPINTNEITHTQRLWISYRDKYCKYIFESYSPGLEAPIEELNCMVNLTAARISELFFIRTGVHLDGFYKQAKNSETKITPQTADSYSKKDHRKYGEDYFISNCKTTNEIHYENFRTCILRMKYQQ